MVCSTKAKDAAIKATVRECSKLVRNAILKAIEDALPFNGSFMNDDDNQSTSST